MIQTFLESPAGADIADKRRRAGIELRKLREESASLNDRMSELERDRANADTMLALGENVDGARIESEFQAARQRQAEVQRKIKAFENAEVVLAEREAKGKRAHATRIESELRVEHEKALRGLLEAMRKAVAVNAEMDRIEREYMRFGLTRPAFTFPGLSENFVVDEPFLTSRVLHTTRYGDWLRRVCDRLEMPEPQPVEVNQAAPAAHWADRDSGMDVARQGAGIFAHNVHEPAKRLWRSVADRLETAINARL